MTSMWKGRPLSELTKAELIEAMEQLCGMIENTMTQHQTDMNLLLGSMRNPTNKVAPPMLSGNRYPMTGCHKPRKQDWGG